VIFASTNKVIRSDGVRLKSRKRQTRYAYKSDLIVYRRRLHWIFHFSVWMLERCGGSIVRDLLTNLRAFRLLSLRNRVSTRPRQFGVEDQGGRLGLRSRLVSVSRSLSYGDGKQVRDMLHVDDLTRVSRGIENRDSVDGLILNIGGWPGNAPIDLVGVRPAPRRDAWSPDPDRRGEWRQGRSANIHF